MILYRQIDFLLLLFWVLSSQNTVSQPTYSPLPEVDYAVYTVLVDDFSTCNDDQYAHRRGELLFITPATQVVGTHSFRFNFAEAQEQLPYLTKAGTTFYEVPSWKTFITSVDTNQFGNYEIRHPLDLKCRKSAMWSAEMDEYYFSKENYIKRGFFALQNDYKNLGSLVRFSKVVYSTDSSKAMCYYSRISGVRDDAGYLVFLEKKTGAWAVVGSARLWIA